MSNTDPPVSYAELRGLFEHLDRFAAGGNECDHRHTQTVVYLLERQLPIEPMLTWLMANGAGCDCEVMFNTEEQWGERVGYLPPDDK